MLRKAHPFREEHHELQANEVLLAYRARTGWVRSLPVPVEQIIESLYGLRIEVAEIPEAVGETILGRLVVEAKTIELNETHMGEGGVLLRQGPLNFTYAHELGHWLYDVGNLDQLALPFDEVPAPVLCRHAGSGPQRSRSQADLREVNANKFAAQLLLPTDLVRTAMSNPNRGPLWRCAQNWGVSKQTLGYRLEALGFDPEDLS